MRKNTLYFICFSLLVTGVTACGKTTKSKLVNDWVVRSFETGETQLMNNGDISSISVVMNETNINRINSYTVSGGSTTSTTISGTVSSHTFSMKRNGEWMESFDYSYSNGERSFTQQKGTWNFVRNNEEEGTHRNERVLFQVLEEVVLTKSDGQPEQITNRKYSAGSNTRVYTVSDSENKKLVLEMKSESNSQQGSYSYKNTKQERIELQQK